MGSVRPEDARYYTLASAAAGELLGGLESLKEIRLFSHEGPLRGTSEFRDDTRIPRAARRWLDGLQGAAALKAISITGAVTVLTARQSRRRQVLGAGLMYGSTLLSEWRSPYGRDGADQMAGVVNAYRVLTSLIPVKEFSDEMFLRAVNLQAAISYFSSGAAKAISSTWMSGRALEGILSTQMYGSSPVATILRNHPHLMRWISWSTVLWESAFPIIYLLPGRCVKPALLGAKAFHAGVAATMGLPRFFFGFNAAHYSIAYVVSRRGKG